MSSRRNDNLATSLLDRKYTRAAARVLRLTTNAVNSPVLSSRLLELEEQAARLASSSQQFSRGQAIFRALDADLRDELGRIAEVIRLDAAGVQMSGIEAAQQLRLPFGVNDALLNRFGVQWNRIDPNAVARVVDLTGSEAWAAELAQYGPRVADTVSNIALRGIIEGRNPLAIARDIRRAVEILPTAHANNLMRTLQLESYRSAQLVNERTNARLLSHKVRIEVLDSRTCLACWSLHGQIMEIGQPLLEHHQGRATTVLVVKGQQLDIETGPDRFERMLREDQRGQLSDGDRFVLDTMHSRRPGAMGALESGAVDLGEFVQPYQDDVFGDMIREKSLGRVLA